MQTSLVIALVVVLIIAVAAYFWLNRKCTAANCPAPKMCNTAGKCITPCTSTTCASPNYCSTSTGQCTQYTTTVGDVWDSATNATAYQCPTGVQTNLKGWCTIGNIPYAQAICANDPKCTGFFVPSATGGPGNTPWVQNNLSVAQLSSEPSVANTDYAGTTYYQKVIPSS